MKVDTQPCQYFLKACDFVTLIQGDIQESADEINNRPRKYLGMKTPNQVFFGINHSLRQRIEIAGESI